MRILTWPTSPVRQRTIEACPVGNQNHWWQWAGGERKERLERKIQDSDSSNKTRGEVRSTDVNNAHQPLNQTGAGDVRIPCPFLPTWVLPPLSFSNHSFLPGSQFTKLGRHNKYITHNWTLPVLADKNISVGPEDGGMNHPSVENDRQTWVTWDLGNPTTSFPCVRFTFLFFPPSSSPLYSNFSPLGVPLLVRIRH